MRGAPVLLPMFAQAVGERADVARVAMIVAYKMEPRQGAPVAHRCDDLIVIRGILK